MCVHVYMSVPVYVYACACVWTGAGEIYVDKDSLGQSSDWIKPVKPWYSENGLSCQQLVD